MIFKLDELRNINNLENGRPSDTLFTYYVSSYGELTHFEPTIPQYKKLKNGEIISLTPRVMNQNGNIITNGQGTNVVFIFVNFSLIL